MNGFDPDAAAAPGSGLFGLTSSRAEAEVILVPAPFDATTSHGVGTADGPEAIRAASHQVDLFDVQTGRPYRRGIHMLADEAGLRELSRRTRPAAATAMHGGDDAAAAIALVDEAGARVNRVVQAEVARALDEGRLPGVVGGDHAVAFGGIAAVAARWPGLGILHVDAHADLRDAFQGFRWSHASIMHNVLREVADVARLVQVGIRDLCDGEMEAILANAGRVIAHFDLDWQRRLASGEPFLRLCQEAIAALPEHVHVSFDVDGLDPALCPHTGTPVPGGLSFAQACLLLESVQRSGRRIVGFDLTEVAPGAGDRDFDAAIGARLLYKLCGFALLTR